MRVTKLSTIIVYLLLALGSTISLAQPSISELGQYYDKMMSHRKDLIDLGEYSKGSDQESAIGLIGVAEGYTTRLDHLRDLLLIYSLIMSKDDRQRIRHVITERMQYIGKEIDLSLKEVNLHLSHARSPAIISTGNQMKSDLREIQKILVSRSSQ